MDCGPAILMRAFANEDTRHVLSSLSQTQITQAVPPPPRSMTTEAWRRDPPGTISVFRPLLVSLRL
jgi:hypothetical protein